MTDHLDDNEASEFVSGTLAPGAVSRAEGHLARCRDCRQLVAALAGDSADDSNAATVPHERMSPSQVAARPTRTYAIGDRVGRYLVLSALGAGGMGVVFAAYDPTLDRKVAIKLLRAGITYNTKDARTRLRREAQAIAQLSHPNVVNVYDVGNTDDGDLYIAMEFVEGDTLTTWLKKYPRTWREVVDVFLQAARGLVAAHGVNLLHRDFKPDNVLVGEKDGELRVRVTDFGLARSTIAPVEPNAPGTTLALNADITATGTVLGTPRYMAPEQLTGPDIDARADQFSFCVALYEALYGIHPLTGATSVAMLEQGVKALPPPESTKVPTAIARILQRGLERDRGKRFPNMAALIHELAPRPPRPTVRYSMLALAGLLLVGGAVAAVWQRPKPEEPPIEVTSIQPLIDKINTLQSRIDQLETRLRIERSVNETQTSTIENLEQEKQMLVHEKAALVVEKSKLEQAIIAIKRAQSANTVQGKLVIGAVDEAEGPVEGCFKEWSERENEKVAEMRVTLVVNPDGVAHNASATGPNSPSLRFCVSDALINERLVKYPRGPEQLELEVRIQWAQDGPLLLVPRIVGHRIVPQGGIIDR